MKNKEQGLAFVRRLWRAVQSRLSQRSRQRDREESTWHAQAGIHAFEAGDYARAIQELGQTLSMGADPIDETALCILLAKSYLALCRIESAIKICHRAIAANPVSFQTWNVLSLAYRRNGDIREAEKCVREALKINPDYVFAQTSLGAILLNRGKTREAIAALERALAMDPGQAVTYANLAHAYAAAGRFGEARASLRQATVLGHDEWQQVLSQIEDLEALDWALAHGDGAVNQGSGDWSEIPLND